MTEFIQFKRGQQQVKYSRCEPQFEGNAFLPQYAFVPLAFQTRMNSFPLVSVGDTVHEGQIIARAADHVSVHAHASVPGVVAGIIDTKLPSGHFFRGVHIRTEGRFDILGTRRSPYPWEQCDRQELLHFLELAGLVNTAEGITPLAERIGTASKRGVNRLTAVLYDKDPSCCLDSFLTRRFTREVSEGIAVIARALNASKITVELPAEKDRSIPDLITAVLSGHELSFISVPNTYPPENVHTCAAESGAFVIDALTALTVYESVKYNQPMLTTYVLVTGKTLERSKILKIRIGTPIGHLIEECGGFKAKNTHIILNGLLQGILVDSLDLPAGKGIKSIHAAGKEVSLQKQIEDCGHCGQCLRSCPAFIDPIGTVRLIQKKHYTDDVLHSVALCRGCACCSAVCPARIPLCTIIKSAARKGAGYAL
ncbi:MAG: nitrogen fixation protein [Treponema sp.]